MKRGIIFWYGIIIFGILLLTFATAEGSSTLFASNESSDNSTVSNDTTNSSTMRTCEDSDANAEFPDGKNYFQRGVVTICAGVNCTKREFKDRCSSPKLLEEHFCPNNTTRSGITYACPNGCSEGACRLQPRNESEDDDKSGKNKTNPRELCEQKETRFQRIKCRLEIQRNVSLDDLNITEESCLNVRNQSKCNALYAHVRACYNKQGIFKDQCFKRTAGFIKKNIKEEKNSDALRNYMIFLLYNLQEKVEDAQSSGNITSEQGAQLIDLIVSIKQDILNNLTKEEIKPKLRELKEKWRDIMEQGA